MSSSDILDVTSLPEKFTRLCAIQEQLAGPQGIALQKSDQHVCHLLCKGLTWDRRERLAQEVWQLADCWEAGSHGRAKPRFLLSPLPCKEPEGHLTPDLWCLPRAEDERRGSWPRSSSESSAVSGSEKSVSSDTTVYVASFPVREKASKRAPQDQKSQSSFSEDQDVQTEDLFSFSSCMYDTTWTDSSGYSTAIFSRKKSHRSGKHPKSIPQKQKSGRGSPERLSPGAIRAEEMKFPSVPISFEKKGMVRSLETHMVARRLQHLLEMSSALLRSLRSLLPSVPCSCSRRHLGMGRPWSLPFVATETKKRLELQLKKKKKKKIEMEHWKLPGRAQEAFRHKGPPLLPKREHFPVQKVGKKAKKTAAAAPHLLHKPLGVIQMKLKLHLAKKCVEMQAEVFPAVVLHSWRLATQLTRPPLPKLISQREKPLQARLQFLPFVPPKDAKRMDMAVQRWRLSSFWGLGQRYVQSLAAASLPLSSFKRPQYRRGASEFSGAQILFLKRWEREALEAHVRKKRLQHEWGVPNMVQISLKAFLQSFVPGFALRKTKIHIKTLPQELWFLPGETSALLEFHLHRMNLQRRWGLPRRVLEACKLLFPELPRQQKILAVTPFPQKSSLGMKTWAGGLVHPRQEEEKAGKMQRGKLRPAQTLLRLKVEVLKKLQTHLSKKRLEVRLEVFTAAVQFSWQCAWLAQRRSLPKLIAPGLMTPQPRTSCPCFGLVAMRQIELALQWGLGEKHVKILVEICPRGRLSSVKGEEVAYEFSEVTPSFFEKVRQGLDTHINKKKLQHEWGGSSLVQKSLGDVIGEPAHHPDPPKTVTQTSSVHPELHFLSEKVTQKLELHIQRMKLQRTWGLPQRVCQSLKAFHSLVPWEKPQAKFGLGETQTEGARRGQANRLSLKKKDAREDLLSCTLETHLKKKYLEIKFQSTGYRTFSGRLKPAFLPKHSFVSRVIRPRTPCLHFVEQSMLEKMNLNIKHKHLTHLWSLPSMYTRFLNKMLGKATAGSTSRKMSMLTRRALGKSIGQGIQTANATGPRTKEQRFSRKSLSFVQTEASKPLEKQARQKKLHQESGPPSLAQKSRQALATLRSEPERLSKGSGVSIPGSQSARRATVNPTKGLFFFDPVSQEQLEAHVKNQTATHRRGLPKHVQETLKMTLPPASPSQVEGHKGQAEIPLHARRQVFQTVTKQRGKAEKPQHLATVKRVLPKGDLLGKVSQGKMSRCGREIPKVAVDTPISLKNEGWESMGLHVRHKRIHHEWGLPSLVQKSLRAFVPFPPELQKKSLTNVALERLGDGGKKARRATHVPQPGIKVRTPHPFWRFFSQKAKDSLESHLRCWAGEHKWGLPQLIQDSLRAMAPPPQVPGEKICHEHHFEFNLQHGDKGSRSERDPSLQRSLSLNEATENIHQRKPDASTSASFQMTALRSPEVRLLFYIHKSWDLLELHINRKRIQHAWGQPSTVLKSLGMFAPCPLGPEKHRGRSRARMGPRDQADVKTMAQPREHQETSMGPVAAKQRGEIEPSFHRPLSLQPSSQSEQAPPDSLCPCQYSCSQDTSEASQMSEPLQEAKDDVGAIETPKTAKREGTAGATVFSFLPDDTWKLLEFHIQQKRIQHAWGLPSTALKSLQVFAPCLLKAEKSPTETMSKILPRDQGDVQILSQDLSFLSPDTKERLEAHLRHLTSEHRWDLLERAQQTLKAFQRRKRHHSCQRAKSTEETSQRSAAQKRRLDKAAHVQLSRDSKETTDPGILPPSSPSAHHTRKYTPRVGKPKVRPACRRTTRRAKKKEPDLCLAQSPESKVIAWQKRSGFQRTDEERDPLEGMAQFPKPSAASWEEKKYRKLPRCSLCHLSAPDKTSAFLSTSDRQSKRRGKENEAVLGRRGQAVADNYSLLAEDSEPQHSPWSSGDKTGRPSLQEPEAAKMCWRPFEADVELYHNPNLQQVSSFFPHYSHVLQSYSAYEDVVARPIGREHFTTLSSRLQRRGSKLPWRKKKRRRSDGHTLGDKTRCQAFSRTQLLDQWFSLCEKFLCLQLPSPSTGNRSSTEYQGVQTSKESKEGSSENEDSTGADVELQVNLESCTVTLQTDGNEAWGKQGVTFSISKEQSLSSLENMSQSSTERENVNVDDQSNGGSKWLEMKREGRKKGVEVSPRKEMRNWKCASSSVVRQPPPLAENAAPSLVACSEEARVTPRDKEPSITVAEADLEPASTPKSGEILDLKNMVLRQKTKASVDLTQEEAVGQDNKTSVLLTTGTGTMGCLFGMHPKSGRKKELRVSWATQVSRQELLVRGLVFEPKHGPSLENPRTVEAASKVSRKRKYSRNEMAILGKILERKLNLQQGLSVWRKSQRQKGREGRGSRSDKEETRSQQGGRTACVQPSSVGKKCSILSILKGKLHLWHGLCFWRKNREKTGEGFKAKKIGKSAGM